MLLFAFENRPKSSSLLKVTVNGQLTPQIQKRLKAIKGDLMGSYVQSHYHLSLTQLGIN